MQLVWIVPGFQRDSADRCIPALTDLAHRVAQDHRLKVYALQYPGREDCYRVGAVEVRSFRAGPPARVPKLARLGTLARVVRLLWQEPADLLHAFWAAEPALAGVAATMRRGQPLVVSCMGGEPVYLPEIGYGAAGTWLDRAYLRLAVGGSQVITVGSQAQANLLKARFGKRVVPQIMPLGVDLTRFQPPDPARPLPPEPKILAAGSLLAVKGHARLIEAVATLPQVSLKIVGGGPEKSALQSLINRLGLAEQVCLAGPIDPAEMPAEYARASFLVLPSYYESQCLVLLEALACGLPVVAAPVGLAPELLADGKAGELARSNHPEDLAGAITRLLNRADQWPEIQPAARSAAEKFGLEPCAGRLLSLYQSVIEG